MPSFDPATGTDLVRDASDILSSNAPSSAHPALRELVRLLARQAAEEVMRGDTNTNHAGGQ